MSVQAKLSSASLSDADVRVILSKWKSLEPEHVELYVSSGVGRTLINLQQSGFQCTEGDPLLLLCTDPRNYELSVAYLHGGNYALPAGIPGQRGWPGGVAPAYGATLAHLPAHVDAAPPFALGRFTVEHFPEVVDKTDETSMNVLYVPDLEVFGKICLAIANSEQFARFGPLVAARLNENIEPPLVRAFLLDRINGRPLAQPQFTVT
ncbi:hypothetical protein PsorP6_017708 [Peronosclerospora sorghi]|uniref:Uncharacterized protein n=1 Tax=Peronosclerospora sorghi TaxID=230839 RepID=A0ACC0WLU6_9STRA|nr:hypothetical protein PsorP6_017708 [Peronosclerospora sorghi]